MGSQTVQQKAKNPGFPVWDQLEPHQLCEQTLIRNTGATSQYPARGNQYHAGAFKFEDNGNLSQKPAG